MRNDIIEIEEKIKSQVDHIFRMSEANELKARMFDLALSWYMRGFYEASEDGKESKDVR